MFEMISGRRAFSSDFAVFQYSSLPVLNLEGVESTKGHLGIEVLDLLAANPHDRPSAKRLGCLSRLQDYSRRHNRLDPKTLTEAEALVLAASKGDAEFVDLLIPEATPSWWALAAKRCMRVAIANRQTRIVHRLLEAGLDGSFALFKAAQAGDQQEVTYLAEFDINAEHSAKHGLIGRAIKYAIEYRDAQATRLLVERLNYGRPGDYDSQLYQTITARGNKAPEIVLSELFCFLDLIRVGFEPSTLRYGRLRDTRTNSLLNYDFWSVASAVHVGDVEVSLLQAYSQLSGSVRCVAISWDGRYLATRSPLDIRIFDIHGLHGGPSVLYQKGLDGIPSMCFIPESHDFVTAGARSTIWRGNCKSPRPIFFGSHESGTITCLAVPSRKRGILASAATDKTVCIWSTVSQTCLSKFQSDRVDPVHIALHPDGGLIAIGSRREGVELWDIRNFSDIRFQERNSTYRRPLFSPTGLLVLTDPINTSQKNSVCIWSQSVDAKGCFDVYKWSGEIKLSSPGVTSNPDGRWLGFGRDGWIEFRNSATGDLAFGVIGRKDPDREEICTINLVNEVDL
jgi:hypothetical protein